MKRKTETRAELNVFIQPEMHRRLKAYASLAGMSMAEMIESLIEEGVPELRTVDVPVRAA